MKGKVNSQVCLLMSVGSCHLTAHTGKGSPGSTMVLSDAGGRGSYKGPEETALVDENR